MRGARGGAKILLPDVMPVTQYSGAFLQMHGATAQDVQCARLLIEPPATRLVAERRNNVILTDLAQCTVRQKFQLEDDEIFGAEEVAFRQLLLKHTGSVTLILLGTILSDLADLHAINRGISPRQSDRAMKNKQDAVRAKERMVELIHAGDGAGTERLWSVYLKTAFKRAMLRAQPTDQLDLYVNAPKL